MGFLIKLDINGLDKQIEKLHNEIEIYKKIRIILDTSIKELEDKSDKENKELIILLYLKLQSVVDVAAVLNDAGMRIKTDTHAGQRKYSPNDITQIVYYDKDNNSKYFKVAKLFNKYNSRLMTEKELIKQLLLLNQE